MIGAELIDTFLAEVSELCAIQHQRGLYDLRRAEARIGKDQPCSTTSRKTCSEYQKWLYRAPVVRPCSSGLVHGYDQRPYRDDHSAGGDDSVRIHPEPPSPGWHGMQARARDTAHDPPPRRFHAGSVTLTGAPVRTGRGPKGEPAWDPCS